MPARPLPFLLALAIALPPAVHAQGPSDPTPSFAALQWTPIGDASPGAPARRSLGASVAHGALIGAAIGAGAGLLVGAALHDGYSCSDGGFCVTAVGGAIIGAGAGAIVGSIVGLVSATAEPSGVREARMIAAPGPGGTMRVGVSLIR